MTSHSGAEETTSPAIERRRLYRQMLDVYKTEVNQTAGNSTGDISLIAYGRS